MEAAEVRRAVETGETIASGLGLQVDNAVVIHNSDRVALRLMPCDVLARVAPSAHQAASQFEVEVARRLVEAEGPVGALEPRVDPRVYSRGFLVTSFWTYYEPAGPEISPRDYASALMRLHAALRRLDVAAPHFTDRVGHAQTALSEPELTPGLPGPGREFLKDALSRLTTAVSSGSSGDQLLHGEPHVGNLLRTRTGPLFVDLATCCRGPIEFDLGHAPEGVAKHYPGANDDLIRQCRALMWAMFTTWRWRRGDQLPDGAYWKREGLARVRAWGC